MSSDTKLHVVRGRRRPLSRQQASTPDDDSPSHSRPGVESPAVQRVITGTYGVRPKFRGLDLRPRRRPRCCAVILIYEITGSITAAMRRRQAPILLAGGALEYLGLIPCIVMGSKTGTGDYKLQDVNDFDWRKMDGYIVLVAA